MSAIKKLRGEKHGRFLFRAARRGVLQGAGIVI